MSGLSQSKFRILWTLRSDIDVEMETIGDGGMTMPVPDSCLDVVKRQISQVDIQMYH